MLCTVLFDGMDVPTCGVGFRVVWSVVKVYSYFPKSCFFSGNAAQFGVNPKKTESGGGKKLSEVRRSCTEIVTLTDTCLGQRR